MGLKIDSIDIVLVTFHREEMLEKTLVKLKERTKFPHRIILIDNGSIYDERFKKEVIDRYSDIYIKNKENVGFGKAENQGLELAETEYLVTTCNDIVPPDLTPCWLERLSILLRNHPEHAGINCRAQFMPRCRFDESKEVSEHRVMTQSYLRIQRTEEMRSIGGIPYLPNGPLKYESLAFARGSRELLKKTTATATHIHVNHFGWDEENKGYPEGVEYEFKVQIRNKYETEDKTCTIKGHQCPEWGTIPQ